MFFHFYQQKPLHKNLYCWCYFTLVIIWVTHGNLFYKIARFAICNYVKGGGSRFCLVIFNYFSLYHELVETFNTLFSNITQNLKSDSNLVEITENLNISDPVTKAIKKYEKDPSIIKIKEMMKNKNMSFSFSFVTKETVLNELRKLNPK